MSAAAADLLGLAPASRRLPPAGLMPPVVSFSRVELSDVASSVQVSVAGWAFVSWSWVPNIATFGSSLSAGSSHAAWTAGSSVTSLYQSTCVAGSDRYWTNAHAASLFSLSLNTTRLLPPTNDVALTFLGIGAMAHLPSMSAPPASLIRPRCHGPEKNIGWVPATNAGVMSKPSGTDFGREPLLEERLVVGQGLDGLRAVELVCARCRRRRRRRSTTGTASTPASSSCPARCPTSAPPFSFIALAMALRSSHVAGGAVMPAFSAMSVR